MIRSTKIRVHDNILYWYILRTVGYQKVYFVLLSCAEMVRCLDFR